MQPPPTRPANAGITAGQTTELTVEASTGPSPLSYQWYEGPVGTTSISLCTTARCAVSPATTKTYWVRVSGPATTACGTSTSVNSTAATVTVCQPVSIGQDPAP